MLKPFLITAIFILCLFSMSFAGFYQKGNSDTKPENFVKQKDRTTVNYNIKQIQVSDINGVRTAWEYDWVDIKGPVTKEKFKEAVKKSGLEEKDVAPWTPDEAVNALKAQNAEMPNAVETIQQQQQMINSQGFMILDLIAALCGEQPENALCAFK